MICVGCRQTRLQSYRQTHLKLPNKIPLPHVTSNRTAMSGHVGCSNMTNPSAWRVGAAARQDIAVEIVFSDQVIISSAKRFQ